MYQIAKDFQTLIVGVLGFAGVIITLFINAKASRKQHERAICHEQKALRKALIGELSLIRESFAGTAEVGKEEEFPSSAFFSVDQNNLVYRSLIQKIGILSPEEVSAIVKAHTLINELPSRLHILASEKSASFNKPGHVFIEAEYVRPAQKIYASFLPEIDEAIRIMSEN